MKKYFKDTSNLISFILGLIPAFAFYIFQPGASVPVWLLLIILSALCVMTWLFIKSRIELSELSPSNNIAVIGCSHGVCICKPNNLISHSSWVMFYHCSGDYEQAIAYGKVETITQKGIAQIKVFPIDIENEHILEYINNEKANILVRPTLTTEAIQQIANYL